MIAGTFANLSLKHSHSDSAIENRLWRHGGTFCRRVARVRPSPSVAYHPAADVIGQASVGGRHGAIRTGAAA